MSVASASSPVGVRPRRRHVPAFARTRPGAIGCALVGFVVAVAVFGPLAAPHAIDVPIGAPGEPPTAAAPLGTDFLGRDVLSRTLSGGRTVITVSLIATLLAYVIGVSWGLIAGFALGRLIH